MCLMRYGNFGYPPACFSYKLAFGSLLCSPSGGSQMQKRNGFLLTLFSCCVQTYGIKVGYGAGAGTGGSRMDASNKSSSCC